jgi:hypothetical protein
MITNWLLLPLRKLLVLVLFSLIALDIASSAEVRSWKVEVAGMFGYCFKRSSNYLLVLPTCFSIRCPPAASCAAKPPPGTITLYGPSGQFFFLQLSPSGSTHPVSVLGPWACFVVSRLGLRSSPKPGTFPRDITSPWQGRFHGPLWMRLLVMSCLLSFAIFSG